MRLLQALPACWGKLIPAPPAIPDGFAGSRWTLGDPWAFADTTRLLSFSSWFPFPCSVIPTHPVFSPLCFSHCSGVAVLRENLNYSREMGISGIPGCWCCCGAFPALVIVSFLEFPGNSCFPAPGILCGISIPAAKGHNRMSQHPGFWELWQQPGLDLVFWDRTSAWFCPLLLKIIPKKGKITSAAAGNPLVCGSLRWLHSNLFPLPLFHLLCDMSRE